MKIHFQIILLLLEVVSQMIGAAPGNSRLPRSRLVLVIGRYQYDPIDLRYLIDEGN